MNAAVTAGASSAALQARVEALLAERYAPVPRDTHVIAVDVDHVALVMHYAAAVAADARQGRKPGPMTADTAVAWDALDSVIRCYGRQPRDRRLTP
jgi:hypothetical protein